MATPFRTRDDVAFASTARLQSRLDEICALNHDDEVVFGEEWAWVERELDLRWDEARADSYRTYCYRHTA